MIRATSIITALSFAAVAGAQPAKPTMAKHEASKAKTAAPAAAHAAAPAAAAPVAAPAAAPAAAAATAKHAVAPAAKHDSSKKMAPMTKKPGG